MLCTHLCSSSCGVLRDQSQDLKQLNVKNHRATRKEDFKDVPHPRKKTHSQVTLHVGWFSNVQYTDDDIHGNLQAHLTETFILMGSVILRSYSDNSYTEISILMMKFTGSFN